MHEEVQVTSLYINDSVPLWLYPVLVPHISSFVEPGEHVPPPLHVLHDVVVHVPVLVLHVTVLVCVP